MPSTRRRWQSSICKHRAPPPFRSEARIFDNLSKRERHLLHAQRAPRDNKSSPLPGHSEGSSGRKMSMSARAKTAVACFYTSNVEAHLKWLCFLRAHAHLNSFKQVLLPTGLALIRARTHLSGWVAADVDQPIRSELEQLPQEQVIAALAVAVKKTHTYIHTYDKEKQRRERQAHPARSKAATRGRDFARTAVELQEKYSV